MGSLFALMLCAGLVQGAPDPAKCASSDTTCGWTRLLTERALGHSPTIRDMSVDPAGNLYVTGETYTDTAQFGQSSTLLVKYDTAGEVVWLQRLTASGGGFNMAYGIDTDGAGNICIGGTTDGAFGKGKAKRGGGFVALYNARGELRWAHNTPDMVQAVAMGKGGFCYAASVAGVKKFSANGKPMWDYTGAIGAIAAGEDGRLYLTNQAGTSPGPRITVLDEDGTTLRSFSPTLWKKVGLSQPDWRNPALASDKQGGLYLQATLIGKDEKGTPRIGAYLARLDLVGKLMWERFYAAGEYRWDSFDVAVDASNTAYLVGRRMTLSNTSPTDVFALSFAANGTLRWTRVYGTPVFDGAGRIAVDANGNYYIAGGTEGALDGQNNPVHNTAVPFIARNRPK